MDEDQVVAGLIDRIVMAAPDIDAETFRTDTAPAISSNDWRITLYASDRDDALLASSEFHGARRAGQAGPGIVVYDHRNFATVDVTAVTGSHSYIGDNGRVLNDLLYFLDRMSEERPFTTPDVGYAEVKRPEGFWSLEKIQGTGE